MYVLACWNLFSFFFFAEQKERILIPVILAPCQIPLILNSVSKIDFTRPHIQDWMWQKLITSLSPDSADFLSSLGRSPLNRSTSPGSRSLPAANNMPVITFPETTQMIARSVDNPSGMNLAITCGELSENDSKDLGACSKISPPPKRFHSFMAFLKRKGHSSSHNSTISTSSSATSGFYSQSRNDVGGSENDVDNITSNTSFWFKEILSCWRLLLFITTWFRYKIFKLRQCILFFW